MRCLNGEIFARLVVNKPEDEERCKAMGITNLKQRLQVRRPRVGARHHLRRGRHHRRHADAGRALLRRRHPHQLAHHADQSAPHPVHRRHSGVSGAGGEDSFLRSRDGDALRSAVRPVMLRLITPDSATLHRLPLQSRRNVFVAAATGFIGFAGFTVVMPFSRSTSASSASRDVGEIAMWSGLTLGRDAGDHGDQRAALGPRRRSLRQQDPRHPLARRVCR